VANPLSVKEQLRLLAFGRHSDKVLDFMLDNDIKRAEKSCSMLGFYPELSEVRQAVVVDMVFNLGLRSFLTFEKLRNAIEHREWQRAAEEMIRSKWAGQVGPRAKRLANMMLTNEWPSDVPGMEV
jgi:lysozyme